MSVTGGGRYRGRVRSARIEVVEDYRKVIYLFPLSLSIPLKSTLKQLKLVKSRLIASELRLYQFFDL